MKKIDLLRQNPSLLEVLELAQKEPVLLLTAQGKQFFLAEADDFDREVELLRASQAFQRFLDQRSRETVTVPLEEIEKESRDVDSK